MTLCPICSRPLGQKREKHHVIPKSKGGVETVTVHPICHRKIHKVFTRAQLAKMKGELEPVLCHDEIVKFVKWLATKPPDFLQKNALVSLRP